MKDFTDDLDSYGFTGILDNDESFDDSDIEIYLKSLDVVEDEEEEEADNETC